MNNGAKPFLQLESANKKLSNGVLKVKIEHSYEDVVIPKVGLNSTSGGSPRDLVKDSQKSAYQYQNSKI